MQHWAEMGEAEDSENRINSCRAFLCWGTLSFRNFKQDFFSIFAILALCPFMVIIVFNQMRVLNCSKVSEKEISKVPVSIKIKTLTHYSPVLLFYTP